MLINGRPKHTHSTLIVQSIVQAFKLGKNLETPCAKRLERLLSQNTQSTPIVQGVFTSTLYRMVIKLNNDNNIRKIKNTGGGVYITPPVHDMRGFGDINSPSRGFKAKTVSTLYYGYVATLLKPLFMRLTSHSTGVAILGLACTTIAVHPLKTTVHSFAS